jgi:hypothetical protein
MGNSATDPRRRCGTQDRGSATRPYCRCEERGDAAISRNVRPDVEIASLRSQ